ncbi:hypothetical protein [Bradyrhizobium cenepequi]|uniref:hypothetical protein n=1 Tax=Bradyrhizobium cenepequi TaxID=2821403 RepID=UPI001CE34737|nr:hypothetical protein [Bradyrhizobium cenepequi]MCA6108570.1 hypothetical protein [Bradyrhizobium cenepequi]
MAVSGGSDQEDRAGGQLIESPVLFAKPDINFLFDALVLAKFINLRSVEQVRLAGATEDWPDGFIGAPKAFMTVEVTEVMEPGRKRGDEYERRISIKKPDRQ